jgi:hypothetical protein
MSDNKKSEKKTPTKTRKMPAWVFPIQAITWLVSKNEALTLDADRTRIRGKNQKYRPDDYQIFKRAVTGGYTANILPIRTKRAGLGHPDDMGGVTLANLSLWIGCHLAPQQALEFLVQCARSGIIKTVRREALGVPIDPQAWAGATLIEDKDARVLLMVDLKPDLNSSGFGGPIEPLFCWKDVAGLVLKPERPVPRESVDGWLHRYAERYLQQTGRPLSRDTAVHEGGKQLYAVHKVRTAYSSLPAHLKNSAKKANQRNDK